jgi:hypothetical protein
MAAPKTTAFVPGTKPDPTFIATRLCVPAWPKLFIIIISILIVFPSIIEISDCGFLIAD